MRIGQSQKDISYRLRKVQERDGVLRTEQVGDYDEQQLPIGP